MPEPQTIARELRERLLTSPELILEDQDLMRALVAGNERAMGDNIIDMRGLAMEKLEARLARLEETHSTVLAVAYDNLAGTHTVHRAVLRLLECKSFEEFLAVLGTDVANCIRVDGVRLIFESNAMEAEAELKRLGEVIFVGEPGFAKAYAGCNPKDRPVTLRELGPGQGELYEDKGQNIQSEALIRIDLGPDRMAAMLALGSSDPAQFRPGHGTDLLSFFGGVIERSIRRWLD